MYYLGYKNINKKGATASAATAQYSEAVHLAASLQNRQSYLCGIGYELVTSTGLCLISMKSMQANVTYQSDISKNCWAINQQP